MFTGAPLIANVPEEVSVADDKPVEFIDPDVEVKLRAPVVIVNPFEAVSVCVEVNGPTLVVVIPVAPSEIEAVLLSPIVTEPFADVPVPARTKIDPPVEDPAVELAPRRYKPPPVEAELDVNP